ncbi:MAG: hypothetical protein ABEJ55_08995 [Halanaeroarchaeum sp.]
MSSLANRGQIEPLPALVAVSAFVAALSLYAGVVQDVSIDADRRTEETALSATVESASRGGVLDPDAVKPIRPSGYQMRVVVSAGGREWKRGPTPPAGATTASTIALVRTERGESVGRVRIWMWQ